MFDVTEDADLLMLWSYIWANAGHIFTPIIWYGMLIVNLSALFNNT
jgi:hypothetical protein